MIDNAINIAILGAGGIGKIHAGIFHSLGANVISIMGSSIESALLTAKELDDIYGFKTKAHDNFKDILDESVDAVSICTPPHLHFEQIMTAFDNKLSVFCEKPLFWNKDISNNDIVDKLMEIESHPNRFLFMNTSNAVFVDPIIGRINGDIHDMKFIFHTNGNNEGMDIAVDLLPHGISILYKLFGENNIKKFNCEITKNLFRCTFMFGGCNVEFVFQENPTSDKDFVIELNGRTFKRIQEGSGNSYRVSLFDIDANEKIPVVDPFRQYISEFIDFSSRGVGQYRDKYIEVDFIMKTMGNILTEG